MQFCWSRRATVRCSDWPSCAIHLHVCYETSVASAEMCWMHLITDVLHKAWEKENSAGEITGSLPGILVLATEFWHLGESKNAVIFSSF